MDNNKNTLSIAALVLGIVGIIFDFIYAIVGLVAGIVGIVLAVKARKTENAVGMATGGLICSIIAAVSYTHLDVYKRQANEFESRTASYLAAWFNCSNDDIDMDSRSAKKGVEPEAITIEEVDGRYYAFIALERIGGIMAVSYTHLKRMIFP